MEEKFKLPCLERNGKYVTINDCNVCNRRNRCDIYITMLEESKYSKYDDEYNNKYNK